LCPTPLLRYHHIIPWEERHHFDFDDMIALCPEHHDKADEGVITRQELYEAKKSPYNRILVREDDFRIPGSVGSIRLGSNTFINTPRIVVVDELDLVSLSYDDGHPLLNVVMIDEFNNWVGIVEENEWVFDRRAVWDIDYHLRRLTVRSEPRRISLEIVIRDDSISFRGELHYNGIPILISEDDATFGGKNALQIRGSTFNGLGMAVNVRTSSSYRMTKPQMIQMLDAIRLGQALY
jgi:hypothetical protein